jgi:hypothetical protein
MNVSEFAALSSGSPNFSKEARHALLMIFMNLKGHGVEIITVSLVFLICFPQQCKSAQSELLRLRRTLLQLRRGRDNTYLEVTNLLDDQRLGHTLTFMSSYPISVSALGFFTVSRPTLTSVRWIPITLEYDWDVNVNMRDLLRFYVRRAYMLTGSYAGQCSSKAKIITISLYCTIGFFYKPKDNVIFMGRRIAPLERA